MTKLLSDWTENQCASFGLEAMVARTRLHELDFFDHNSLIDLLDCYPRDRLQAFTMGSDPVRREDWSRVELPADLAGKDLLETVQHGRLWLNLLRVELVDRRYRELLDALYLEISAQCPNLRLLSITFATLIISSPSAMVYYHLDAPHQALWHVRGLKRAWIYPAGDERLAPRDIVEQIFAGTYDYDEELPFSSEFDDCATVFDLHPGEVLSWPHNAPHRVTNLGTLNVSLSTGFSTIATERRALVYAANRFFRRRFGVKLTSVKETGLSASAKCLFYRACRRAGLDRPEHGFPVRSTKSIRRESHA